MYLHKCISEALKFDKLDKNDIIIMLLGKHHKERNAEMQLVPVTFTCLHILRHSKTEWRYRIGTTMTQVRWAEQECCSVSLLGLYVFVFFFMAQRKIITTI